MNRRPRHATPAALALVCLSALGARGVAAQGVPVTPAATSGATGVGANLNISPKRITFDRAGRSATVYVFNQGVAAATFEIALVDRVMLPDGQIIAVGDAEAKPDDKPYVDKLRSAKSMLVIAPRRAILAPGRGQTIRIRVAQGPAGEAGAVVERAEYRTHLTVTTIPPKDIGLSAEEAAVGNTRDLRFRISTMFGISIPVIVRVGPPDVRGGIEDVQLTTKPFAADGVSTPRPTPTLTFQLVRLGPNSMFGTLEVRGAKERGAQEPLGLARGVGVYPEIERREMQIPLKRALAPGEQIEITFKDDDITPGRLIARATFKTP